MRKSVLLFLIILLFAEPDNSFSEGKWIIASITPLAELYVKHLDNRKTDEQGRIRNWSKVQYNSDESTHTLVEYDCDDRRVRVLESVDYFNGEQVEIDSETKGWSQVIPESIDDISFMYVCEAALPGIVK